ncbi:MAG: hypothetical protein AB2535_10020 [Candidatus Thiodiazotropha endolucinida]
MLHNYLDSLGLSGDFQVPNYLTKLVPEETIAASLQVPEWWSSALQRIAYLIDLPENWDSYGAKKIDAQIAYYSVQILQQISVPGIPMPSIVPTVRGNLQFEWHIHGIDLEFEVVSPVSIYVAYEDSLSGTEWDRELDYNLTPLSDVLKTLLSRTQANQEAA